MSEGLLLIFLWQQNMNVVAMEIKLSKQKYNFQLPAPARVARLSSVMMWAVFWWAVWLSPMPALPLSTPHSAETLAEDLCPLALFNAIFFFCLFTCSHMLWQSIAAFKWSNSCLNHSELCLKQAYFSKNPMSKEKNKKRQILVHLHAVLKSPPFLWIKLSNFHTRGTHGKTDTTRQSSVFQWGA